MVSHAHFTPYTVGRRQERAGCRILKVASTHAFALTHAVTSIMAIGRLIQPNLDHMLLTFKTFRFTTQRRVWSHSRG